MTDTSKDLVPVPKQTDRADDTSISLTFLQGYAADARATKRYTKDKTTGEITKESVYLGSKLDGAGNPIFLKDLGRNAFDKRRRLVEYCRVKSLRKLAVKLKEHKDSYRFYAKPDELHQNPGTLFPNGEKDTFVCPEGGTNLLMNDIDGIPCDLNIRDHEAVAVFIREQFKAADMGYLCDYEMVVVFSASLEVDRDGHINEFRAHIYHHLNHPIPMAELRAWALGLKHNGVSWIDPMVLRWVQPDYFCRREYVGMKDWLREEDRIIYVPAAEEAEGYLVADDHILTHSFELSGRMHAGTTDDWSGEARSGSGYMSYLALAGMEFINEPCYRAATSLVYQKGCAWSRANLSRAAEHLHAEAWKCIEKNIAEAENSAGGGEGNTIRGADRKDRKTYDKAKFVSYLMASILFIRKSGDTHDVSFTILRAGAKKGMAGLTTDRAKKAWEDLARYKVFDSAFEEIFDEVVAIAREVTGKRIATRLREWLRAALSTIRGNRKTAENRNNKKQQEAWAREQEAKQKPLPPWWDCFGEYDCLLFNTDQGFYIANYYTDELYYGWRGDIARFVDSRGGDIAHHVINKIHRDIDEFVGTGKLESREYETPNCVIDYAMATQRSRANGGPTIYPFYDPKDSLHTFAVNRMYDTKKLPVRNRLYGLSRGGNTGLMDVWMDPLQRGVVWKLSPENGIEVVGTRDADVLFTSTERADAFPELTDGDLARIRAAELADGIVPPEMWSSFREFFDSWEMETAGAYQIMATIIQGCLAHLQQPVFRCGVSGNSLAMLLAGAEALGSGIGKSVIMAAIAMAIDPHGLRYAHTTGALTQLVTLKNAGDFVAGVSKSHVSQLDNVNRIEDIPDDVKMVIKIICSHSTYLKRELFTTNDHLDIPLNGLLLMSGLGMLRDQADKFGTDVDLLNRMVEVGLIQRKFERSDEQVLDMFFKDEARRKERTVQMLCCLVAVLRGWDADFKRQFHRIGDFEQTFSMIAPSSVMDNFIAGKRQAQKEAVLGRVAWIKTLIEKVEGLGGSITFESYAAMASSVGTLKEELLAVLSTQRKSKREKHIVGEYISNLKEATGLVIEKVRADGERRIKVSVEGEVAGREVLKVLDDTAGTSVPCHKISADEVAAALADVSAEAVEVEAADNDWLI